jgi:chemotaxis-related protein WspB
LTFTVAGEPYALDVAGVIELVPRVELRAIPHAPAYLAGLLGYRGDVVPVIDLGLLLGSSPCAEQLSTRIILVKSAHNRQNQGEGTQGHHPRDAHLLGLIAEQVIDLTRVDPEQISTAPVHLPRTPYLDSVARTERGFVPLIAVEKLSLFLGPSSSLVHGSTPSSGAENLDSSVIGEEPRSESSPTTNEQ